MIQHKLKLKTAIFLLFHLKCQECLRATLCHWMGTKTWSLNQFNLKTHVQV